MKPTSNETAITEIELSFQVMVTFDLTGGDAKNYDAVTRALTKMGIIKLRRPENTYVGSAELRVNNPVADLAAKVTKSINDCKCACLGTLFAAVVIHGKIKHNGENHPIV